MRILPITSQNDSNAFKGIRYQNGIRTKNALSENIKKLLRFIELSSADLKNVDLILTDEGKLQLNVNTPRYLSSKFNRFYRDENYEVNYYDGNDYSGKGYSFHDIKNHSYLHIKLRPTEEIGIYDIIPTSSQDFGKNLSNTLEAAKLIENVSTKIRDAEKEYGMDCVNVLNNLDDLKIEAEHMKLIDSIKQSYVLQGNSEKCLEKWDLNSLYQLENQRANIDELKHYKVALVDIEHGGSMLDPCLLDENGYLDEVYKEFYERDGLNIKSGDGFHREITPCGRDYPSYSFGSNDGKTYYVCMDTYESGHNLSSFYGNHFRMFLEIAGKLDRVGDLIEKYLNTGK